MMKTTILIGFIVSIALTAVAPTVLNIPKFDLSKVAASSRTFTSTMVSALAQATSEAPTAKKGMTWEVTNWPLESNSWTARVGCANCDAYNGDTLCTQKLPLLCLIDYKTVARPFYNFTRDSTAAIVDGGFYNGWTGGYFAATEPILGTDLTNRNVADKICQGRFGATARAVDHHLGFYMDYMNDLPNVGSNWNWSSAKAGGWAAWGYIKGSLPCGRMWTLIDDQVNGNCGV